MADIRAYQPSFTAGALSPALWARVDLSKYATGLKVALNVFVHPHGGVSNRTGTEFIREVKSSTNNARTIPFQFNGEQSYILEFGDKYFRVYRDGGIILSGGVPYEVVTPYEHAHIRDIVFTQEADVMYLTHEDYAVRKISRLADDNWTIATATFAPSLTAPATPTGAINAGTLGPGESYAIINHRYKISAVSDEFGDESLPSGSVTLANDLEKQGAYNQISWSAKTGAARYIVYKEDNGVYGYIGGTENLFFRDDNITPDLSDGPQTARNPFDGAGNYPRCSTFVEQRLFFGSTKNEPQAVWGSQSGNYENFGYSRPAKASDSITFRIRARQVNEIRAMLPIKGLMILTSGSEILVTGGAQSDAITPSSIKTDPQGYRGAAKVQPIAVGNTVLFAQKLGGVVRDFSYEFEADGFTGKDLTILARHLFEGKTIVAWGYAQAPYSIVWVVLNTGELVSLTYMREQDVWAWTHHESAGGFFEDVTVIGEDGEDVPYFIVRRSVGGVSRRYIERLRSRAFSAIEDAFFVDCGLTYVGAPATTISGLGHLEGRAVVALADGNVVRNLLVTGGAITLPVAAIKVHIGLPIVSAIQTLDIDLGAVRGMGTVQGRKKSISSVVLRVERTRGIFTGPRDGDRDSQHLVEYKQRSTEAWSQAIQMYTGDIKVTPQWDWTDGGNMWVKQFDPLPMTILAIMPDVTVGG